MTAEKKNKRPEEGTILSGTELLVHALLDAGVHFLDYAQQIAHGLRHGWLRVWSEPRSSDGRMQRAKYCL